MNKTAMKNFSVWARQKLIKDITYKAKLIGVSEKGVIEALPQSTNDLKFFDIGTKDYVEVSGKEIEQREALINAIKEKERYTKNYKEAYEFIIEKVAYTWFNRLIAVRFMEVNDYLPSGVRVLSSENKEKNEPDFVTNPFEAELDLTPHEQDKVMELKEKNKSDELFRMLFIKQCNKLHECLPRLFERTNDYTELLLTISYTDKDGIIYHLVHDIDEDDFNVEKEGQIEIIGWLYQFYNTELKAKILAETKGKKVTKEQIPVVTQLFTPAWIVRYIVENSLGRLWYERNSDNENFDNDIKLKWKYYIDEAEQELEVQDKLKKIREEYKLIELKDLKIFDPCMGSGHILVYAFDVLMQIYESHGYTQRDAVSLIIENNIFGLDIDERAEQLTYFAIMMKGRQYDRRFLSRNVNPNVYSVPEVEEVDINVIDVFEDCSDIAKRICEGFIYGKECGSLIVPNVSIDEIEKLNNKIEEIQLNDNDILIQIALEIVVPLINVVKILVQKYDVCITNPPYLGTGKLEQRFNNYVKKSYSDSKIDLFSAFIERCMHFTKENGFQAMITMHSWMFLSNFEKLREKILQNNIVNMVHLGTRAFEEIGGEVVQTTSFVLRISNIERFKATYCRLIDSNNQNGKEEMFLSLENRYEISHDNFFKIPGTPIAYWVSDKFFEMFNEGKALSTFGDSKEGLKTGDNERFLRKWFEVELNRIKFDCRTIEETKDSGYKWFPHNKGGGFRKWYGNDEYIVNWENDGYEIRNFFSEKGKLKSGLNNLTYMFKPSVTWSKIMSGANSFRYKPFGYLFDSSGLSLFPHENIKYFLSLCNTKIIENVLDVISPTINCQSGDVAKIPIIESETNLNTIEKIANENIEICKHDWDSFETSWNFEEHPLVKWSKNLFNSTQKNYSCSLELCFLLWQNECDERFNILKDNEEELNRIFIDIYDLKDEINPDVEDKYVTARKADLKRDIKSLISYAIGCILGRYSLDIKGLVCTSRILDETKYKTFVPDSDNCIPITDEEYFEDDIVGLFVNFIRIVFGKDDLESNLDYIANVLGNKGDTSRRVIRNYFLNDFIKDHIKIYQKRPIYWLFDSGKNNGFKALVYMHRWNSDIIGNMRVEYLHRMQRVYEREINRMQEIIDNSIDNKEVIKATRRKEKLQKQLKETREYDSKIAHLAVSQIDINLDDGVNINYEKVQTIDGNNMQILAKI